MEPIGTTNQSVHLNVSENEKKQQFEELVKVANKILAPDHIDLSTRAYNSKKDALAFLVEYAPVKDAREWKVILEQFVKNLETKDKADATYLIDTNVQLAVQSAVSEAVERLKNQPSEIKRWHDYMQMNANLSSTNQERRKKHEPVNFSGVPRNLLPDWYLKDHGEKLH